MQSHVIQCCVCAQLKNHGAPVVHISRNTALDYKLLEGEDKLSDVSSVWCSAGQGIVLTNLLHI